MQYPETTNDAVVAFGNTTVAAAWLVRPNPLLNGDTPLQAVHTAEGRKRIRRQLAWFKGERCQFQEQSPLINEHLSDLFNEPFMELVLQSAGTGPEEFLSFCEDMGKRLAPAENPKNSSINGHQAGGNNAHAYQVGWLQNLSEECCTQ